MISIIIPLFNEEANVPILAGKLSAALRNLGRDYEVIFINDGSIDATGDQIKKVCAADPCLKSINLRRNYGQTTAIVAGFHHGR